MVLSRYGVADHGTLIGCPPRREKIYCDKWIHDGTCAFTQQGCKFKHEMPMDKETQQGLGLFHGLPPWFRKHQAEQVMYHDDRPIPLGGGVVGYGGSAGRIGNPGGAFGAGAAASAASRAQNWRRIEAGPGRAAPGRNEENYPPLSASASAGSGLGSGVRGGARGGAYGGARGGSVGK